MSRLLIALGLVVLITAALASTAYADRLDDKLQGIGERIKGAVIKLIDVALRVIHGLLPFLATLLGVAGIVIYPVDHFRGKNLLYGAGLLAALWVALPYIMGW